MKNFNVVLFDGFETLDAFGPAEIFGKMPEEYNLKYFSIDGGIVKSSQNAQVHTHHFSFINEGGILLIPGGMGTRELVNDAEFIEALTTTASEAEFVLSVCTGSALLAKTGLLNGRNATSNKKAFEWVQSVNTNVNWVKQARWVVDGNFYTSSGISAGMDMALGFISDKHGKKTAQELAKNIEYVWNDDKDVDPFS
jgi:Transcriptional regulator containing an amidase domain and an AraC-type DNA-binding HTH domain